MKRTTPYAYYMPEDNDKISPETIAENAQMVNDDLRGKAERNLSNVALQDFADILDVVVGRDKLSTSVPYLDKYGKVPDNMLPDYNATAENVGTALDKHKTDKIAHVTAAERTKWNAQAGMESGTFVGTGDYGSNGVNNTLTFQHVPKLVFVGPSTSGGGVIKILMPGVTEAGSYYNSHSTWGVSWSEDNKTVTWRSSESARHQCNEKGVTYFYHALY